MKHQVWNTLLMLALLLGLTFPSGAQTLVLLHNFKGGRDGSEPHAAFLLDSRGNLYSTTFTGGGSGCERGDCGTIFKLSQSGQETLVHRFVVTEGAIPTAALIRDPAGNFYGTTSQGAGGSCFNGCGSVFKLTHAGQLTVLHVFTGGTDGANPTAGLVSDPAGNLYGVTFAGGTANCIVSPGCGTIFKIDPAGNVSVLHTFTGGADGANPNAALVRDRAGNLYGTASNGGALLHGNVFKLDSAGSFTVLYNFAGATAGDGAAPYGSVMIDRKGNLFGTTIAGGAFNNGAVYKLDTQGKETVFYSFTGGSDGQFPWAALIMDEAGNLYSTTSFGGNYGDGTVFELDPTGNEKVLHSFNQSFDGQAPISPVIMDAAGNLYGTCDEGGSFGLGTAFKLTPQ
jgi:uncharacterized repeat protein (TIGR03803 family)